jgi:hypothetical protein
MLIASVIFISLGIFLWHIGAALPPLQSAGAALATAGVMAIGITLTKRGIRWARRRIHSLPEAVTTTPADGEPA